MIDIHDPEQVRAATLALVEAVQDAEQRAREAQSRMAELGECSLQLLALVEQHLRAASERVDAAKATLEQERREQAERLRQAEIRAAEAEQRAEAAEDLLDDLRAMLARADQPSSHHSTDGVEHALH
ncbi:hypothetical protein [Salinarimonas soli]|uniref:Uncharacterized protein n=1 Tax=Salinarimonas soli TaxID=1638099 RepID=A0A5B2VBA3_9HYPH|nr:hypothetical protein [Salinarimonas soli]KAA2235935.1 hypothetical protein F0L46_17375 [Salinarimonas soli]